MSENEEVKTEDSTKVEEARMEEKSKLEQLHKRYFWIDQARGLTILFLFISSFTWIFSGGFDSGTMTWSPPIGPTWLNHGWKYFDGMTDRGDYPIITIIDMGAQIFMFILGISVPISFRSKRDKKGAGYAWTKVGTRFFGFLWISAVSRFSFGGDIVAIIGYVIFILSIVLGIVGYQKNKESDKKAIFGFLFVLIAYISFIMIGADEGLTLWTALFGEPLCHLAWGTLAATILVALVDKPDERIWAAVSLIVVHAILWEVTIYRDIIGYGEWRIDAPDTIWNGLKIPFDVIGHMSIAIAASCIWDWIQMDPNDGTKGMKKRVLPFVLISLTAATLFDFIQPADHHGTSAALVLMTWGATSAFVMIFYALENYYKADIPILTALGRNALFLYLFQGVFTIPYSDIFDLDAEWLWGYGWPVGPLIGLALFVLPIALCIGVGVLLHKKKIYFKF